MGVVATDALRRQMEAAGEDLDAFMEAFAAWREDWPKYEHESYLFGKEGGYRTPKINGKPDVLRHVHLAPIKDKKRLKRWKQAFTWRGRKVSDRCLVFVHCPRTKNDLLIYVIPEPKGHEIATSPAYKHVMDGYAKVADDFLFDGRIEV